jgi:ABC-type transport system involved in cytochrome bd biosynthesis fused ATPase/permease subunit
MPKVSSNPTEALVTAISQQSRFHTETIDTTVEVDLHGVSISIGQRELISSSRLKLKNGVRYALIGRCGKSMTIINAIG